MQAFFAFFLSFFASFLRLLKMSPFDATGDWKVVRPAYERMNSKNFWPSVFVRPFAGLRAKVFHRQIAATKKVVDPLPFVAKVVAADRTVAVQPRRAHQDVLAAKGGAQFHLGNGRAVLLFLDKAKFADVLVEVPGAKNCRLRIVCLRL